MKAIEIKNKYFPTKYKLNTTDYAKGWNACLDSISNLPIIDVKEIVHAHWIDHPKYMDHSICSYCKSDTKNKFNLQDAEYDYCPHCGARMDEEVMENND